MADVIIQTGGIPVGAERAAHKVSDIVARLEWLPLSNWHVRTRLVMGIATFFDAFDALAIAYILPALIRPWGVKRWTDWSAWSRLASIIGPLMVGFLLTRYTLAWMFLIFGAICVVGGGITALFATETCERLLEEVSP